MIKKTISPLSAVLFLLLIYLSIPYGFTPARASEKHDLSQELTDLKIAVGAYNDRLYKIAADYFEEFLKKYPHSMFKIQASMLLGDSLSKIGKNTRALDIYRSIIIRNPRLDQTTLIQIHYAIYNILKKKHPKEAFKHLKFIVDFSLKNGIKSLTSNQAFLTLVEYYKKKNRIHTAESVLDKFLLLSPPSPWRERALLQKIIILTIQKRFKESLSLLEPVIKNAKNIEGYNKEFFLYWAISNIELKRYCVAQETYKKLIKSYLNTTKLSPVLTGYITSSFKCFADEHVRNQMFLSLFKQFKNRPSLLFKIYNLEGLLYFQEGKYGRSRDIWINVLERFPDHPGIPGIIIKLDKIFRKQNDLKTWESLLLKINKGKKYLPQTREVVSLFLGNLYFSRLKYETAIPFYFNIINKVEYRKFCLERIILCYYYLKKYKEAKINLGILTLENPQESERADILFLQADIMLRSGKTDNAMILLKKIVEKKNLENRDRIWAQKAKLELGKLLFLRKNYKIAKSYLIDVLKESSYSIEDNRTAAFYLGLIAEQEKKPELSETYFQIASLTKNKNIKIEALFRLGLAKKSLKNYQESIKIFKKIINSYANNRQWSDLSRLNLAELFVILHDYNKAKNLISFLLEKSKDVEIKKGANNLLRVVKKIKDKDEKNYNKSR